MSSQNKFRLIQYTPGGARENIIQTRTITVNDPVGDAPTMTFTVDHRTMLPDHLEIGLEFWDGTEWVEPNNGRFIASSYEGDETDKTGIRNYTCIGLLAYRLQGLRLYKGTSELVDGARRFNSATAGAILKTLIDEGQTRGWRPEITYDFTAVKDSSGDDWEKQVSIGFRPGISAFTILQSLFAQGMLDFYTSGRTLHLLNAQTGTDRTEGNTPLRLGSKKLSLKVVSNIAGIVSHVMATGDGISLEIENEGVEPVYGRTETFITYGGVSDEGTLRVLAEAVLNQGKEPREEIKLTYNPGAEPHPYLDYQVGDWIQVRREHEWKKYRVAEIITIQRADGLTVTLILNDRFTDLLLRLTRRQEGIIGGSTFSGGSGAVPSTEDRRKPKAPIGLVGASTGYFDNNVPKSQISMNWEPVTQGENSVAIDVSGYEVWARPDGEILSKQITEVSDAVAHWSPFEPGTKWFFKVRAISANNIKGPFSAELEIIMDGPVDELEAPSPPGAESSRGVVSIYWDGLLNNGLHPPSWFVNATVEMSDTEEGDYEIVGTIVEGRFALAGLDVGSVHWFRLVGVDILGRNSDPSEAVSVEVVGIDGPDIIAGTVTANQIAAGSIEVQHLASGIGEELDISSNSSINIIANRFEYVEGELGEQQAVLEDLSMYYRFTSDGALIGKANDPLQLSFDNESIKMLEQGNVIAEWRGATMYLSNLEVLQSIIIGNHQVEKYGDGTVVRSV